MPQNEYYYDKDGVISGPVPVENLLSIGIARKTLIWKAGMEGWLSAELVPDLTHLFQALPPPVPSRAVPPPIPSKLLVKPPIVPTGISTIVELFTSSQFLLPQFGKFKEGKIIVDNESGETLVSFVEEELMRYQEDVVHYNKPYFFNAYNELNDLIFTLYKPTQKFSLNIQRELHIIDSDRNHLAICRAKGDFSGDKPDDAWIVVYTPSGEGIMQLNIRVVENIVCIEVEIMGGKLAVVMRAEANNERKLLVDKSTDRYNVKFLQEADGLSKCMTFGAVAAFDLFCAERTKIWK
jgi:hypothetical protein